MEGVNDMRNGDNNTIKNQEEGNYREYSNTTKDNIKIKNKLIDLLSKYYLLERIQNEALEVLLQ